MSEINKIQSIEVEEVVKEAVKKVVKAYETLTPQTMADLIGLYEPQARFKDPFNEVVGAKAIQKIFDDMFIKLDSPRFVVISQVSGGYQAALQWEFRFQLKGKQSPELIRGSTWLEFSQSGLISNHRDYWDAAEELYEKIPILGALMRWLKRKIES